MGLFSFFRRVRMGKCLSCEHEAPIRDFGKEYRDEYGTSVKRGPSRCTAKTRGSGAKGSGAKSSGEKGSKRSPRKSVKGWTTSSKGSSKGSSRFERVEDKGSKGSSRRRTNKKTKTTKSQKGPSYDKGASVSFYDKGAPSISGGNGSDSRHDRGYEEGAPPPSGNGSDSRHDRGYEEGAPPSGIPPTGV